MTEPVAGPGGATSQVVVRLLARWWWLGAGVLVGGVVGVVVASLLPKGYDGRATLLVSPSKLADDTTQPLLTVDGYVELVRSAEAAQRVVAQLDLGRTDGLTPLQFLERRVTVRQVRGTQIIEVAVRLGDPARAAAAANALVKEAVALIEARTTAEAAAAVTEIGAQLGQARTRLDEAQARLLATRSASQVELVEKDSTSLLSERAKLLTLEVDIAAEQGRIAMLATQVAKTQQTVTVERALDRSTAMLEANRPGAGGAVLDLQMKEQVLNPAYQQLQEALALARGRLAGLEESRQRMRGQLKLGGDSLPRLNELYKSQTAVDRLKAEYEIAVKAYGEIAEQHDLAALRVMTRTSSLQLVNTALVPEKPSFPSRALFAIAGALLAAILAAAAAVVRSLPVEA